MSCLAEQHLNLQISINGIRFCPCFLIILFLGGPLNEEIGWRGLLQRELGFMEFWKSSLTIGVIWGIWHAPIILQGHNYPEHPVIGVFMMTIWCILLAPIFSYIRLKSKSVIAAAIMHG